MSFNKNITDEDLNKIGFEGEVKFGEPLSAHTTFKIGGKAEVFLSPTNIHSLFSAVTLAMAHELPYFVLGGGSNVVFADDGFTGVVISTKKLSGVSLAQSDFVRCGAGASMSEFVSFCTENALSGAEEFAGLPGSVGGAVYMNARCFDKSVSDLLYSIEYLDLEKMAVASATGASQRNVFCQTPQAIETMIFSDTKEKWGYKKTPFQNTSRIIIAATFRLHCTAPATEKNHTLAASAEPNEYSKKIAAQCAHFVAERKKRGHFDSPSAGSVFKNNHAFGAPSGKLIDEAGLRGTQIGGAQIAPWHGNFIINTGGATAADVRALVDWAIEKVRERTGFTMETEIIFVDDGRNLQNPQTPQSSQMLQSSQSSQTSQKQGDKQDDVDSNILISLSHCDIATSRATLFENISWQMRKGQTWLVIGRNGSGVTSFLDALAGERDVRIVSSQYFSVFADSVEIVSLEKAARVIAEERENDESDYIDGGVDIGRTGRVFIAEPLTGRLRKGNELPEIVRRIESFPAVKLCGVENILDRGIKYMSTGEVRRTLLARALVSGKRLLILSNPFAGLDVESRAILLNFFNTIAKQQNIILATDRYAEIPDAVTHVLEFENNAVSFCGERADYERLVESRAEEKAKTRDAERMEFAMEVNALSAERAVTDGNAGKTHDIPLIEMNHVNVGWGENKVLVDLTWALRRGEHWLIRGPNGSGKTTFLELITGDNMQVFSNDVRLFGYRRGSGETIWDIKKRLGIVSYRMHVEYRMVNSTTLLNVIVSGFHDSIGLYEKPTDTEIAAAHKWLTLAGFAGRENESFGNLSYGEQRAILILRAAVKCPPVLILDEPCHGLDENYRQKILDLLEIIAETGDTTLLHVTHEVDEVLPCEKHILELLPKQSPMYRIDVLS